MNEYKNIYETLLKYGQNVVMKMASMLSHTTNLKNNLIPYIEVEDNKYTLNIKMPYYATFVNDGRRPGSKMPPISSIEQWASDKGLPTFKNSKGVDISSTSRAFLIARAIGRDGIKPIPFMEIMYDNINELNKMLGASAATDLAINMQIAFDEET